MNLLGFFQGGDDVALMGGFHDLSKVKYLSHSLDRVVLYSKAEIDSLII